MSHDLWMNFKPKFGYEKNNFVDLIVVNHAIVPTSESKNYVISGHGWFPLCYKLYRFRLRKYLFLGAQHGMFVNFGAHFLKRVHPYESKNIIPQPFHLKGPWV